MPQNTPQALMPIKFKCRNQNTNLRKIFCLRCYYGTLRVATLAKPCIAGGEIHTKVQLSSNVRIQRYDKLTDVLDPTEIDLIQTGQMSGQCVYLEPLSDLALNLIHSNNSVFLTP